MLNRFPVWKNCLILIVIGLGLLYALPNLFGDQPSVQISPQRGKVLDAATELQVDKLLSEAGLKPVAVERSNEQMLVRFDDDSNQLKAADILREALADDFTIALNLASTTPGWLRSINAQPMYLGLDLRGGVHFLLQVDMEAAVAQARERYDGDIRSLLRNEKIRYQSVSLAEDRIEMKFADEALADQAVEQIEDDFPELQITRGEAATDLIATLKPEKIREIRDFALHQNITTLRNRVNELGVAEPLIQQQGSDRIVVQLPGVQDTARAKDILGATATLEFRLVDTEHDLLSALKTRPPIGSRIYHERSGQPILLKSQIIVTGDQIVDASSGLEQQSGTPAVFISLDGVGAKKMGQTTQKNIGTPMAVVFIENKVESKTVDGKEVRTKRKVEEVINVATIRDQFSKRFQISGLDSAQEARDLALLLRAGALAAPVDIVEERTVGPSLGKDNIEKGVVSVVVAFVLVLVFMWLYYKKFGLVANLALAMNVVLLIALLSMLQATLTLPGIAGIVLTVGMAVDANVLIFERIKEELRNRNSPQASIHVGYDRAFSTIFDANLTTLIVAVILFGFGTGPIKGFAVTLSLGILSSMFTAIWGTRMIINFMYGGRHRVDNLPI